MGASLGASPSADMLPNEVPVLAEELQALEELFVLIVCPLAFINAFFVLEVLGTILVFEFLLF